MARKRVKLRRRAGRIVERAALRRVQSAQARGMRSSYVNFPALSRKWARAAVRLDAKAARITARIGRY